MPRIPLYYSVLNFNNDIILSQITQDENYSVGEGQRLVKDQVPDYDSISQYIIRVTPVPENQDYIEYQIKDITYTDEQLANGVINQRNDKLLESDWTQLPDIKLTSEQVNLWRMYRQELRDITEQLNYPRIVTWPVKPE